MKSCQKCFIFGDFNYHLAKTVTNSHVSDVTEIMLNHCFNSLINKPTRISQESAAVLDHILFFISMFILLTRRKAMEALYIV